MIQIIAYLLRVPQKEYGISVIKFMLKDKYK